MIMYQDALLALFHSEGLKLFAAFISSFVITYFSIPIIVNVSKEKQLFVLPNGRTSHEYATPTLGGIAMFAGVTISSLLFTGANGIHNFNYVIAGSLVLFFFGMKDDLIPLVWYKKAFGEILAAFFLIILADLRITDLHGIFGIHHIGYLFSTVVTLIIMIGIVNAMNLIDGIDGLAAGLSFMATAIFGSWFFLSGQLDYALVAIAIIGMLLVYFGFNVFAIKYKIFMGDTGALLLGYLMTIFVIAFNQHNILAETRWHINNAPVISFAILFIPLIDTMRVMVIRLIKRKAPFSADRNHIHHLVLNLGWTHLQTTLLLMAANGCITLLVFVLRNLETHLLMFIVLSIGILKCLILVYMGRQWKSPVQKGAPTFKNASREVARSIYYDDVKMKN